VEVRFGVITGYNREDILAPFCFYRILPKSIHTDSINIDKITGVFGRSKSEGLTLALLTKIGFISDTCRLNMELDLQVYSCSKCTAVLFG
jgi:hypothetical protein